MAMIGDSSILMFDEPSEGIDPITRKRFYTYLRNMEHQSVMLITQRIDEAESICDSIVMLMKGRVRDQGTPGYLKQRHGKGYQLRLELSDPRHMDIVDFEI